MEAKIKPITVEDYKDYAKRHGIEITISDDELQEVLDKGNKKEREFIEERDRRREEHREEMRDLFATVEVKNERTL